MPDKNLFMKPWQLYRSVLLILDDMTVRHRDRKIIHQCQDIEIQYAYKHTISLETYLVKNNY